jgi:hypothetical protein
MRGRLAFLSMGLLALVPAATPIVACNRILRPPVECVDDNPIVFYASTDAEVNAVTSLACNFWSDALPPQKSVSNEDRNDVLCSFLQADEQASSDESTTKPGIVLLNGGSDVRWAASRGDANSGPALYQIDDVSAPYFEKLLHPVSCQDEEGSNERAFALPLGIHRTNVIFINRCVVSRVLEKVWTEQAAEPEVLTEYEASSLDVVAEKLQLGPDLSCDGKSAGNSKPITFEEFEILLKWAQRFWEQVKPPECKVHQIEHPFALPVGKLGSRWPLTAFFYEDLMVGIDGLYNAVWHADAENAVGKEPETCGFHSSDLDGSDGLFARFKLVAEHATPVEDKERPSWKVAVDHVRQGCALAAPSGDWAVAEFYEKIEPGCLPESITIPEDVAVLPFPGTEDAFVFALNTTAVRADLDECKRSSWLEFVQTDRPALMEYSRVKGSIPPLTGLLDTDLESLSSYQKEAYQRFKECESGTDSDCQLFWAVSGVSNTADSIPPDLEDEEPCEPKSLPLDGPEFLCEGAIEPVGAMPSGGNVNSGGPLQTGGTETGSGGEAVACSPSGGSDGSSAAAGSDGSSAAGGSGGASEVPPSTDVGDDLYELLKRWRNKNPEECTRYEAGIKEVLKTLAKRRPYCPEIPKSPSPTN